MVNFISNTVQVHIARFFEDINDWKILLLKRSEHLNVYPGIWQVITGTVEKGEKAVDTAKREVNEETGIIADDIFTIPYVTTFFDANKNAINFSPVFGLITDSEKIILSDEHSDYSWYSLDECEEILVLPSHNEANHIFYDYILKRKFINFNKKVNK